MIDINLNNKYDVFDATSEIITMLVIAFVLGYLFSYFLIKSKKEKNPEALNNETKVLKKALENCMNEKAEIKKAVTLEYTEIIDEYKLKLHQSREDLENCLADKSDKD